MRRLDPIKIAWRAGRGSPSTGSQSWPRVLARIAFGLLPALLGAVWLRVRLDGWMDASGDLAAQRLFSFVVAAAIAAAIVTALVSLDTAISGDEPIVLLILPLTPAERLWIATLRVVRDWRCMLVLTSVLASAAALAPVAPFWAFALLGGGSMGSVAGGAGAICGVVTWTRLPSGRRMLAVAIALAMFAILVGISTRYPVSVEFGVVATGVVLGLCVTSSLLLVNRAKWLGGMYVRAVQALATPAMSRTVRRVPGAVWIASRRGATAAIITKDVLVQGRDPFFMLRVVVTVWALPAFLLLRQRDILNGWSDVQLVSCLVAALTIYSLVDTSPSPIGAEGERLGLWILAPTSLRALLLAKLGVHGLPLLFQGVVMVTVIGVWIGMSALELAAALVLVPLLIAGPVTFLVLVSASDIRLDVPLESGMPTTLHEHMPHSPRRLWLVNGTILLVATGTILVWWLPPIAAILLLVVLDATVAKVCWTTGHRALRSLTVAHSRVA